MTIKEQARSDPTPLREIIKKPKYISICILPAPFPKSEFNYYKQLASKKK